MRILLTLVFILLFVVGIKAQSAHEVNTVDDVDDGVCNAVHCSLREAINAANADGVNSLIVFRIDGLGTKVITLDTELPAISGTLKIDGNTLASNLPTTGRLVLDGNGLIKNGLHLASGEVEIYGVQFQQFLDNAILIESLTGDFINSVTLGKREKGNIFIKNGTAVSAKNLQDLVFQANYVGTNLGFEEGFGNQNGIIVDNNWTAAENSLLIIGGESDRLQHNYFASSTQVALSLSYQGIATIEGNTFGTGKTGNENLGNRIALQTKNGRGRVDIGGAPDTKNTFAYNENAVIIDQNSYVNISENSFYCNGLGLDITKNTYPIPTITSGIQTKLSGIAQPLDVIEIYLSDEKTCDSENCQGMTYVGTTTASAVGEWEFAGRFAFGQQIVALSRNSGRQSMFSQCFRVCTASIQSIATNEGPYCKDDTIQLSSNIDIQEFAWDTPIDESAIVYDWQGPNGFNSNEKHPKNIADKGDYILQTFLLGCPTAPDTTEVKVAILEAAIAEVPATCRAESILLNSVVTSSIGRVAYHWSGPDGYTSTQQNPTDAQASGVYDLFVSGDGCQSEIASVVVTNHFPEPFSLGATASLCTGESLSLTVPNYDYYQWSGTFELACDTCANVVLTPTESGTIQLQAGPTTKCVVEAVMDIAVIASINVTEERTLCPGSSLNLFTETIDKPGTYQASFTAQSGCDSTHTFIVTKPDLNRVVENKVICEGDAVKQFGETYSASGTYQASFTAANGCDSTHVLQLDVLKATFVTKFYTICAGETIDVFGTPVGEPTSVSKIYTASNGCDSTHQINVFVKEAYQKSSKITLCSGETAQILDGLIVEESGMYQKDFTAINGCDSLVLVEVQVLESIETFQYNTMCDDEALALFGDESAFPGNYSETFTAQSGCDSVNYVTYDIRFRQEVEEFVTICGTDRYLLEGNEVTESGRYSFTYTAANGCDSTHITDIHVLDIPSGAAAYELCPGETMDVFGTNVGTAGVYAEVFASSNGCDSTHLITISIKETQLTSETRTICEGETITIFDKLVTLDEVVRKTFAGANGCDSTHAVQVTMLQNIVTEEATTICELDCIELYGATACANKIYEQTFTAQSGCDSTHTLLLTTTTPQEIVAEYSLCQGDSIIIFDDVIRTEGIFSQTFTGSNGCDSMQTFIITQPTINQIIEEKTICEGETVTQFGQDFSTTGRYEAIYQAANGCDSTHVLTLNVLTPTAEEETFEICAGESAIIFGETVETSSITSRVFTAANGCDSTHTITVFVKETQLTNEARTICEGETITIFDKLITSDEVVRKTFAGANGCDSTHAVEVTMLQNITTEGTKTICEATCVELYGATACANKIYEQTFTAQSGCDSTHTLLLTTTTPQEIVAEYSLCQGDSIIIFEDVIRAEGIFSQTFTGINGCDSMQTFIITQPTINQVIQEKTICEGETVTQFGQEFSTTGRYEAIYQAVNGCDSTHVLALNVLTSTAEEETFEICAGESVIVFGETVETPSIVSETFTAANGCDSMHTVTVFVKEARVTNEARTICEGEAITIFDKLVTSDEVVRKTFAGINGCDSTHVIEVTMLQRITTEETETICEATCVELYGATACANKIYEQTFTAQSGCDSTHTLLLTTTIPQEIVAEYSLCQGDSIIIFDDVVSAEGIFSQTFTGINGCDSMQTFIITQPAINQVIEEKTICEGETVTQFGQDFSTTGRYEAIYQAANGCDSTHILALNVLTPTAEEEIFEICAGEFVIVFGETIESPSIVSETFTAANGCDSMHTVTVFVKETQLTNEARTICEGESIMIFDKLVTSDEVVRKTFAGANGCDSTHAIEVTMLQKITTEGTETICEATCIELYGVTACLNKMYQQTFTAQSGCDSTHTSFLITTEPEEIIAEYSLCQGDSLLIFDNIITTEGIFSQTFTGANGCDSMQTFIITQPAVNQVIEEKTICAGETVTQFGQDFSTTGRYEASFQAANGCDSTHVLELTVLTSLLVEEVQEICTGSSVLIFGESVEEAGIISKIFTTASGCDSTHIVTVLVKEALSTEEEQTICAGESIEIFNQLITSDEVISQTFTSTSGCDSTHTIAVTVLQQITTEAIASICATACVELYGATACADKIYQQTFTASSGCDSIHTLFLTTTETAEIIKEITLCSGDSIPGLGGFIKEAGTFSQTFTGINGCDSTQTFIVDFATEMLTNIITSPSCLESNGGSIVLTIDGGVAPYRVYWEGNDMGNSLAVENLEPGNYEVQVIDDLGCEWEEQINIEAIPAPIIEKEVLGITCFGANDGAVDLFSNQADLRYSLNGTDYAVDASFSALSPAVYEVFIKDAAGCIYTDEFTLFQPTPLDVTLPAEETVKLGASVQLEPIVSTQETIRYDWESVASLSCLDCEKPVASPTEDTQYTLTIYDENNCESQAQIWVRVDDNKNIYVPNVFSPDDDGLNDKFTLLTIDGPVQEVETFKVYDRWGNLVYEANNFDPLDENFGWDGRYKGKIMDNAVFIYYIKIKFVDGTEEELKGGVTLTK